MITVDLRIKNTDLTITSVEDLIKFEQSESKLGIEGTITHDEIKHHAYSLAEVMLIISSLNIGDLSELSFIEVDLENSSEEIQEIILDAVVEIESLESKSEVQIGNHKFHNNILNNSVYQVRLFKDVLMILNVDKHDRFLFNNELQYETKCSKHITLNDSQIDGIKSHFTKELVNKYDKSVREESRSIDLIECHESIHYIALGLVKELDNLDKFEGVSIMANNFSFLESKDAKYSIFMINKTLFAHKVGSSFIDILNGKGIAKIGLTEEQVSKWVTVDFENEIEPYIVQLDEEREEVLNS